MDLILLQAGLSGQWLTQPSAPAVPNTVGTKSVRTAVGNCQVPFSVEQALASAHLLRPSSLW